MTLVLAAVFATPGCPPNAGQGGGLFGGGASQERWTIRCARLQSPNHADMANVLAGMLRKVPQLKPREVRIVSTTGESVIYYGEYRKITARDGTPAFPPEYQRDIELIRSLSYQNQTPFFFAGPELLASPEPVAGAGAEGDLSTARGAYSLQIAVFYNTGEFTQRKEAAEAYVKDLRRRGYPAYYYHEDPRSFVMVGDFEAADLERGPDGQYRYGPRVQQFIARNPEEFRYVTENGMKVKRRLTGPDGKEQVIIPESLLVPVRGASMAPGPAPSGPQRPPAGRP
ncbi:MAG: hypothetical protein AMXMBFR83_26110 [Phycisphaerae bacterium]